MIIELFKLIYNSTKSSQIVIQDKRHDLYNDLVPGGSKPLLYVEKGLLLKLRSWIIHHLLY